MIKEDEDIFLNNLATELSIIFDKFKFKVVNKSIIISSGVINITPEINVNDLKVGCIKLRDKSIIFSSNSNEIELDINNPEEFSVDVLVSILNKFIRKHKLFGVK